MGGQSFRWKVLREHVNVPNLPRISYYIGVMCSKLWLVGREGEHLLYSCLSHPDCKEETLRDELSDYFQLSVCLSSLYLEWSARDPMFDSMASRCPGVRTLRQDPIENVFSFICSANNHISRISGMVERLCQEWGDKVGSWGGVPYHAFPSLQSLAQPQVESRLRELGFGYRAKYIQQTAVRLLQLGGDEWLQGLRKMGYWEARKDLMQLSGVGPKVADCILLMSLDKPGSVPVDTHIVSIARRYLPELAEKKTVTAVTHRLVGDYFRELYGDRAGWAQSVLFTADLKFLHQSNTDKSQIKTETIEDKKPLVENPLVSDDSKKVKKNKTETVKIKTEKIEGKMSQAQRQTLRELQNEDEKPIVSNYSKKVKKNKTEQWFTKTELCCKTE